MRESHACRRVLGALVLFGALLESCQAAGADPGTYDKTIARALRLLPRRPDRIVVVDTYPHPRLAGEHPRQVEAFVTAGQRVVFLLKQGVTLQQASRGAGIFDYALATVIWHEMSHIDGADEAQAQRDEEDLWLQFVVAGRVDSARGLAYLALLKKRTLGAPAR